MKSNQRKTMDNTVRVAVAKYVVEIKNPDYGFQKVYFDIREDADDYAEGIAEENKAKLTTYDLVKKTKQY